MGKLGSKDAPTVLALHCPSRRVLDLIADKWAVLVIHALDGQTLRFKQHRRAIEGISQKMLTQTLKNLEAAGLIARRVYATIPPAVEYSLTQAGEGLLPPLQSICDWAEANMHILDRPKRASRKRPQ
jgi:DNA-binding HxlR family transcriptional regulator